MYFFNVPKLEFKQTLPRLFTPIRKSGFIPGEISSTLLKFCSSMNNRGLLFFFISIIIIFSLQNILPAQSSSLEIFLNADTIANVVTEVGPAVVNIDVVKLEKYSFFNPLSHFDNEFGFDLNPKYKDFFSDKIIPLKGAGSGFIINKEGYILTNEHVVQDANKIKVTLKDGRNFDAKLIGKDITLDIAVIKIDAHDLPIVEMGDSNLIRPGEWVVSIGNPYGFSNTVTAGIISATGRNLKDLGKRDLIQTDAAINPGNSGGPLLNIKGKVIGINVAIIAQAQGIGFAIPINVVKDILQDLIIKGRVSRPWLGIYMRDVNEKIASYLNLAETEGVVAMNIVQDSPADKMGIKQYDVVKKINSNDVLNTSDLQEILAEMRPGEKISMMVYRGGKNINLEGRLGEKNN